MNFPGFRSLAPAKRPLAAAALIATLALAGCGGDSDSGSGSAANTPAATSVPTTPPNELPEPPSAEVRVAAAKAKAQADTSMTMLRTCFKLKKDYGKCAPEVSKTAGKVVKQGTGPGEVEISGNKRDFTITSRATNDAGQFVITKRDGEKLKRTCSGTACPAGGEW